MTRENIYWIRDKLKGCIEHGWKEERKNAFETKSYCANWDDNNWSGDRAYKSLFIHVPRTGGTSIRSSLEKYSLFSDHHLAKDIKLKSLYKDFFFYTILRNPYERMVSIYEYVFGGWGYIRKLLSFYQATQESSNFLNYRKDRVHLRPGTLVTSKAELLERVEKNTLWLSGEEIAQLPTPTKENFSFERFVNIITEELWDIMWEPQTSYIFDDNDKLIVDYVGRTETLQKDLDYIINHIEEKNALKINPIPLQQINNTQKSRPRLLDYYRDENIKKKVAKYYERDIDYLKIVF